MTNLQNQQKSNGVNKKLTLLIVLGIIVIGGAILFQTTGFGTAALWKLSNGGKFLFPLISVAAIIDSINPCAFSILILTIAFLFSIGSLRSHVLAVGAAYILGIFLIYVGIGLGILQALHLFNTPHFMARVGATILVAWGLLELINEFFPAFPIKLRIPQAAHAKMAVLMEKSSIPTAFLLGALVGLCEFPCTGGPYLMALGLLHDHATYFKGLGYLVYYNLIFVLPLVIILLIASNKALLDKVQTWKKAKREPCAFGAASP